MSKFNNKAGFSAVELILVLVVIAIIGALGYVAYNSFYSKSADDSSQVDEESPTASDVETAPEINDSSDLDAALETLDQTDVEGGSTNDEQQLDSQVSEF